MIFRHRPERHSGPGGEDGAHEESPLTGASGLCVGLSMWASDAVSLADLVRADQWGVPPGSIGGLIRIEHFPPSLIGQAVTHRVFEFVVAQHGPGSQEGVLPPDRCSV